MAFEDVGDDWTRISLADLDADPKEVVAELRAKGFDATLDEASMSGDGSITMSDSMESGGGIAVAGAPGSSGASVGFSVAWPEGEGATVERRPDDGAIDAPSFDEELAGGVDGSMAPDLPSLAEESDRLEEFGVRLDLSDPTTLDVRDGADVTIVVFRLA